MSIKVQKIILFIPIINIVTAFSWCALLSKRTVSINERAKTVFKIALAMIAVTAVRLIFIYAVENVVVNQIVLACSIYFYFFSMSYFCVKSQEKILSMDTH